MKARLAQLRLRWRRIPTRARMGLLIAVIAIAGLTWQHHSTETESPQQQQKTAAQPGDSSHHSHDRGHGPHAVGEYQPAPSELPPPPDFSAEAARATAERFAKNFASPNGNRDNWLARITPDVMPGLLAQYRLTDIRNLPQALVEQVSGPLTADPAVPTFEVVYSNNSRIEITLEMDITGWKVSTVVPVDAPTSPAGPTPATGPAAGALWPGTEATTPPSPQPDPGESGQTTTP